MPSQFVEMIPYVLTIVALAGVVGRAAPPAALGKRDGLTMTRRGAAQALASPIVRVVLVLIGAALLYNGSRARRRSRPS